GMIGLGRMGANMTERLVRGGHRVVGFDPKEDARKRVEDKGAESAVSLQALIAKLKPSRTLWMMVPAGAITDTTINMLLPLLEAGDTLIDGGNSNYKDTLRRASVLAEHVIHNGIEYGLMQAYAEGFSILQHKQEFGLDLHQIAEIWRYGSVVRSWLLDLTADALNKNPTLKGIAPHVEDSGEGRWTVSEAID